MRFTVARALAREPRSKLEVEANQEGWSRARSTGMVPCDENALYKASKLEESGAFAPSRGRKKTTMFECHSTAGCARVTVIIRVKTRRSMRMQNE